MQSVNIYPAKRRDLSSVLLLALPLLVLLVPQGAQEERSGVLEAAFLLPCIVTVCIVFVRWAMLNPNLTLPRHQLNPLLLFALVYFELINPMWSLGLGNDWKQVLLTAIPFLLMGVYYLFVVRGFDLPETQKLVEVMTISGGMLASVVVINFFVADLTEFDMRSAQIENERNLALPLLASAGVLALSYALTSVGRGPTLVKAAGAILVVVAILMTVTRALLLAYLVGAVAMVMLLIYRSTRSVRRMVVRRTLVCALLCGLLAIPFSAQWIERISGGNEGDTATIVGRVDEYLAFYKAFLSSPLLGKGMGYVVTDSEAIGYQMRSVGVMRPHSHLFFFAGTTGLVGLLLYYGILGAAFMRLWKISRIVGEDTNTLTPIVGMIGAGIAGILYTLTSTTYNALSYNIFLGILIYMAWLKWKQP